MKVYTIIVTYNGEKWIENCLKSILKSNIPTNILIVDNCSSDKTIQIINSIDSVFIELIKLNENFGFGKANNIGIKKALEKNSDYVFLLNQDTWIEEGTIKTLLEIHKKNKNFGLISPVHFSGEKNKLDYKFANYLKTETVDNLIIDLYPVNKINESYEINKVNAAAWLLPISTIKKVGFFSSMFYHYGEDWDYCNRIKYHKMKIVVATNSTIYHDRPQGFTKKGENYNQLQLKFLVKLLDINRKLSNLLLSVFKEITFLLFKKQIKISVAIKLKFYFFNNVLKIIKERKLSKQGLRF